MAQELDMYQYRLHDPYLREWQKRRDEFSKVFQEDQFMPEETGLANDDGSLCLYLLKPEYKETPFEVPYGYWDPIN